MQRKRKDGASGKYHMILASMVLLTRQAVALCGDSTLLQGAVNQRWDPPFLTQTPIAPHTYWPTN